MKKTEKQKNSEMKKLFKEIHNKIKTFKIEESHFPPLMRGRDRRLIRVLAKVDKNIERTYSIYNRWEKVHEKLRHLYYFDPEDKKKIPKVRELLKNVQARLLELDSITIDNLLKCQKEVFEILHETKDVKTKNFYGKHVLAIVESLKNEWGIIENHIRKRSKIISSESMYTPFINNRKVAV